METIETMIKELEDNNMRIVYIPRVSINRGNYFEHMEIEKAYEIMKNKPDYFSFKRDINKC